MSPTREAFTRVVWAPESGEWRAGGVLRLRTKPGVHLSRADVQRLSEACARVAPEPSPLLLRLGRFTIDRAARDFLAKDATLTSAYTACAILPEGPVSRVLAGFFVGLNKLPRPCRVFRDESAALEWLADFRGGGKAQRRLELGGVVLTREPWGVKVAVEAEWKKVDLAAATAIVQALRSLASGAPARVLVDLSGVRAVDREARSYLGGRESAEIHRAVALIVRSPVSRVIASFFVGINRVPYPIRLFGDEASACDWLEAV